MSEVFERLGLGGRWPTVPAAQAAAFGDYQRLLARRVAVVAAWTALLLVPALEAIEYWLDSLDHAMWRRHVMLRVPLLAGAVLTLVLRYRRPDGGWPRPLLLWMALVMVAVGWALLVLHYHRESEYLHLVSHNLTIAMVAAAVMATRGLRDLLAIYLLPVGLAVLAIGWLGPRSLEAMAHIVYPVLAMVVGGVIAELLYRGHVLAFLAVRRLEESAMTDPLCGLLNRRAMNGLLAAVHARAARYSTPYAVIMADLDHFKRVNDTHGHDVGDQVLRELAGRLRESVRAEDQVSRWGGEEFLVLLQGAEGEAALRVAEKIRGRVGEAPFATTAGDLPITISLGVAVSHGQSSPERIANRADEALYAAKHGGRNRSVLAADGDG